MTVGIDRKPGGSLDASRYDGLWFRVPVPVEQPRMRLFCFPYAGGSATIYHRWPQGLPAGIELWALQLPGRSFRLREPPILRMQALVEVVERELRPWMGGPFAFFGHSMGALVAFELVRHLRRHGLPLPRHLFLSGRRAPHLPSTERERHTLPDDQFMQELHHLNGTPRELLQNAELMAMVMPALRADFEVIETYRYQPEIPLAIPMSVYGGTNDPSATRPELEAWRVHAASRYQMQLFPGDHFFLNTVTADLLRLMGGTLEETIAPG